MYQQEQKIDRGGWVQYNRAFNYSRDYTMSDFKSIFDPETIIGESIVSAGLGAVVGGVTGIVGKYGLSFFNPTLANTAGTFFTFAGVGAIAYPLMLISLKINNELLNNCSFLNDRPLLKSFINLVLANLIMLASITAAAAMLGTPLGTTALCMMILPLAIDTLGFLYQGLSACLNTFVPTEEATIGLKV